MRMEWGRGEVGPERRRDGRASWMVLSRRLHLSSDVSSCSSLGGLYLPGTAWEPAAGCVFTGYRPWACDNARRLWQAARRDLGSSPDLAER